MTRLPRTYAAAELTSPVFMLAVALLVLNDWVLKAAVGSWWTGKLSDFAGLFALATLVSALLPGHRRVVCASTAVGFLIWKSPASGPALAAWNSFDLWPLARVVDYTDWLAVLALVPVWRGPSRRAERSPVRRPSLARRAVAVAAAVAAIAAFTATSVARPNPLPNQRDYAVPGAPGVVRAALDSLGFRPERRGRKAPANAPDTVSLYVRHPPERWIAIRIEVRETAPGVSAIRLIERISQDEGPAVTIEALDRAFRAQVVEPLRDWLRRM